MTLLGHRTIAFLVAVLVAWGAWEAFTRLSAPGRIDAQLQRALGRERLVNVSVTLGFAPEDFHIRLFQGHGVVSGVRGTTVLLNRVSREEVERIARYYWVRRIAPQ